MCRAYAISKSGVLELHLAERSNMPSDSDISVVLESWTTWTTQPVSKFSLGYLLLSHSLKLLTSYFLYIRTFKGGGGFWYSASLVPLKIKSNKVKREREEREALGALPLYQRTLP
ncbi:hypothetical protein FRX31_004853 [Thalictrum thalictroides]|uniref:Uncharacterized protein n=1 Tax=Thalictrum thalictroides TaxID=46969 RepID=A0A7J6X7G3_THATH|nr:hypothetical protein FRX31_004853 [Thalictrum thalictroides]